MFEHFTKHIIPPLSFPAFFPKPIYMCALLLNQIRKRSRQHQNDTPGTHKHPPSSTSYVIGWMIFACSCRAHSSLNNRQKRSFPSIKKYMSCCVATPFLRLNGTRTIERLLNAVLNFFFLGCRSTSKDSSNLYVCCVCVFVF